MTSSGATVSIASEAALPLVKGTTSCPSARSSSVTIWTIVTSSSASNTLAIAQKLNRSGHAEQVRFAPGWRGNEPLFPGRIDDFRHLEDGQKHGDDDAAHDYAQENDQQRLNERSQTRECRFDFLVKKVCHPLEHRVNFAGLFAGGHHADNHGREDGVLADGR